MNNELVFQLDWNTNWITEELKSRKNYLLKIISDLELALLRGDVGLDFSIGVVDDGQKHIEKYKEHKEHVGDEKNGTKHAIGGLQRVKIEISQDDSEQRKAERKKKTSHSDIKKEKQLWKQDLIDKKLLLNKTKGRKSLGASTNETKDHIWRSRGLLIPVFAEGEHAKWTREMKIFADILGTTNR